MALTLAKNGAFPGLRGGGTLGASKSTILLGPRVTRGVNERGNNAKNTTCLPHTAHPQHTRALDANLRSLVDGVTLPNKQFNPSAFFSISYTTGSAAPSAALTASPPWMFDAAREFDSAYATTISPQESVPGYFSVNIDTTNPITSSTMILTFAQSIPGLRLEGILASLKSGSYDSKWFFFSTRYQIRLKLNGEVAEKLNDYSRWKIANYAWEVHMHKFGYGSTLAFQKRFFAEYGIDPVPGY
eukprot:scaffold25827_cov108-Isochrysis_galbana.AAC.3